MNGIEFVVRDMLGLGPCTSQELDEARDPELPGPRVKGCRLTDEQIIFIAEMKGVVTIRNLQKMMDVSRGEISNIWTGRDARVAKAFKHFGAV